MEVKTSSEIPFFNTVTSCGLFGIAEDFTDNYLSLDRKYLHNKESTFFIRASGHSMEPKIFPGDILIVDKSIPLQSGKIAAFYFNGNAICKQYIKTENKVFLKSFNHEHKDIEINEGDDLQLFGVIIGLARDL